MKKSFEINSSKIDFTVLWKIGKIDVDKVTFIKYTIERNQSLMGSGNETIVLSEVIGEETHKCQPSIIQQLRGRVGDIVKGFKMEKKGKAIKVSKIIELDEKDENNKQEMKE